MKILQINKFYYLRGGCERHYFDLIKLLENKGHQVIPFSMRDENNLYNEYEKYFADHVRTNSFNLKNIIKIFHNRDAVKKLKKLIKTERPELAHLHNIYHHLSPAIITAAKKNNLPVVMTLHDYKIICPNYRLYHHGRICSDCQVGKYGFCFKQKCVRDSYAYSLLAIFESIYHRRIFKTYDQVDLFIAPSEFMKVTCVKFGLPEEKIKVIRNFSGLGDARKNDILTNVKAGEPAGAKTDEDDEYLLYYGRLVEEKGVEILLKAMADAKINLKLKIVGIGPKFNNYKSQIERLKLGDRVSMPGSKYGDELLNLIINAKAVVVPSLWPENMPLNLLEAMSFGRTVIASDIGGITEIIDDGINGFLFRAGSAADLAKKIENLQRYDLIKIGKAAKKSSLRFNKENYYASLNKIYSRLVKK